MEQRTTGEEKNLFTAQRSFSTLHLYTELRIQDYLVIKAQKPDYSNGLQMEPDGGDSSEDVFLSQGESIRS